MIGFNAREWNDAGGDQPDGNAKFFQEATVLDVYYAEPSEYGSGGWLASLRWHDRRTSRGHFVTGLRVVASSRTDRGDD